MAYTGKKLESKLYDVYTKEEADATTSTLNTAIGTKVATADIQNLVETYSPPTDLSPYSTTTEMNTAISTAVGNVDLSNLSPTTFVAPVTSEPSSPSLGQIYYNTTDGVLLNYNGAYWQPVGSGKLGTYSNPAQSAKAIVDAGDDDGDGFYYILVNNTPTLLFCDMTFNPTLAGFGRGWTKVANGCTTNTGAEGSIYTGTDQYQDTTNWKLADADINNIMAAPNTGIWVDAGTLHGSDTGRLVKFEGGGGWTVATQMTGTAYQWNGSGWSSVSTAPTEDRGPSMNGASGWYFSGENYTNTSNAVSDFRWYYTGGWSNRCLLRTTCSSDSSCNGSGAFSTFVY